PHGGGGCACVRRTGAPSAAYPADRGAAAGLTCLGPRLVTAPVGTASGANNSRRPMPAEPKTEPVSSDRLVAPIRGLGASSGLMPAEQKTDPFSSDRLVAPMRGLARSRDELPGAAADQTTH